MALMYARETYDRRGEGASCGWSTEQHVLVADEQQLAVNVDKPHRHNDGSLVAARRKSPARGEPRHEHSPRARRAQVPAAFADDEH